MKIWKHVVEQPFIVATGFAALIHSTWSLGTLFAGQEPQQNIWAWLAWLTPALLIAFSLDIGQIVTSAEIRAGQKTWAKYATFIVFALATYYLQWLYIAEHMPTLALAPGVRQSWAEFATVLRDAAIWFIPALLPMSTTLYTFSHKDQPVPNQQVSVPLADAALQPALDTKPVAQPLVPPVETEAPKALEPPPETTQMPALPAPETPQAELPAATELSKQEPPNQAHDMAASLAGTMTRLILAQGGIRYEVADADVVLPEPEKKRFPYRCPACGYSKEYESISQAAQGRRAHERHCKVKPVLNGHAVGGGK